MTETGRPTSRYAERMRRLRVRLDELTEALYAREDSGMSDWELRETIHITLESLPKRDRTAWLSAHSERLAELTD